MNLQYGHFLKPSYLITSFAILHSKGTSSLFKCNELRSCPSRMPIGLIYRREILLCIFCPFQTSMRAFNLIKSFLHSDISVSFGIDFSIFLNIDMKYFPWGKKNISDGKKIMRWGIIEWIGKFIS